jgi:hypothetical protein
MAPIAIEKTTLVNAINELIRKDEGFAKSLWLSIRQLQDSERVDSSSDKVYIDAGTFSSANTSKRGREDDDAGDFPSTLQQSLKRTRVIGAAAICVNCGTTFNIGDDQACRYHDEGLEEDEGADFFADHDEDCHGRIDDDWTKTEYPEGYQWTCCEQSGTVWGCREVPRHESRGHRTEYARLVLRGFQAHDENENTQLRLPGESSSED